MRPLFGGVVRARCDGPVYIGFDQQENIRVWIKEYMPQGLYPPKRMAALSPARL